MGNTIREMLLMGVSEDEITDILNITRKDIYELVLIACGKEFVDKYVSYKKRRSINRSHRDYYAHV